MPGPINPVELSFDAPQTNSDGSNLTDLKEYRVYIAPADIGPWTQVYVVAAASANPSAGERVFIDTSNFGPLTVGQYYATIKAYDLTGNPSVASAAVPFVVGDVVAPSPPTGLSFA